MNSFNNVVNAIIIAFSSILYIGTTYHTFLMDGDYLFGYILNTPSDLTPVFSILSWLIVATLSTWISYHSFKHYTDKPLRNFWRWLLIMLFVSLVFINNRAWYCFMLAFYLPIFLVPGFYFIHGAIHGFNSTHYRWKISVFNLTLISILLVGSYLEYRNTLFIELPEDEQFDISLSAYSIPTFLDWQVEMEIDIEDKTNDESYEFDFSFGDGPYFSVHKSSINPHEIIIKGEKGNSKILFIDLKTNTIQETYSPQSNLIEIASYTPTKDE